MHHLSDFEAFYELANRLIDSASKEQVAEVARLLALSLAHYQLKFGELPLETFEEMMRAQEIDPETEKILTSGMETLTGVVAMVIRDSDTEDDEAPVH